MPAFSKKQSPLVRRALRQRKLLYIAGSVVATFLLLNYVLLPLYVSHGSTLIVPNVTGLPLAEAQTVLEDRGLEPVQADTRADAKVPVGSVVGQNPPADATVKNGRRVYLTLSGGETLVVVPQLRGRSPRDAKFTLERYGLTLGQVEYSPSELYPENTIIDQSIQQDSKVAKGSSVRVVVSQGKALAQTTIPDLVGRTVAEAGRILQPQGLKVGKIVYQTSLTLLPNTIVDQFPRAGESVARGQAVDLFVVKTGKPVEEIEPPQ